MTKAGGGIRSKNVRRQPVRYGQSAQEKKVRGVSQIGQSMGNHATQSGRILTRAVEPVRGGPIPGVGSIKLGNEVARNVGKGGCGTGRTLYGQSGTQGTHGPVNLGRSTPTRDILNDFGPDSASLRGRR
jgi:hypothetical protein